MLFRSEAGLSKVISVLDTPDSEIPADLKDAVEEYRTMLKDAAAESDEALMERYLLITPAIKGYRYLHRQIPLLDRQPGQDGRSMTARAEGHQPMRT